MKPVLQTRFEAGHGNCLNACVASILELPLGPGGVPEEKGALRLWLLEQHDLGIVWVTRIRGTLTLAGWGHFYLASGQSPRNPEIDHAIVMCDGEEVHDPHPERRFLAGPIKDWGFVIRMGAPR